MTGDGPPDALPIRLRPLLGETAEAFVIRMANANHLRPSYLRRYITPGRQGFGSIDIDKLAAVSGRTTPTIRRMFPELAARREPRQPGTTIAQRERKQRNDERKRDLYTAIRRDDAAGLSMRAIQRKHHVGYRTVAKALDFETPPDRKEYPERERPVLQQVIPHIEAMLAAAPSSTAREIWEHLIDEHHTTPAYQTIRDYTVNRRGTIQPSRASK
jgi:lambda repressor-like predicted transcriptional regulator